MKLNVIDLFCGAGALSHGFMLEGFNVLAGVDADEACRYAYELNNGGAQFLCQRIEDVDAKALASLYPERTLTQGRKEAKAQSRGERQERNAKRLRSRDARQKPKRGEEPVKVLIGAPPCQPFCPLSQKAYTASQKWELLSQFADKIRVIGPDVVVMENVPTIKNHQAYWDFIEQLSEEYSISTTVVYSPDYGVPQMRKRLILTAMYDPYHDPIELLGPTHLPDNYRTVRDAIGDLPAIGPGEVDAVDWYHRASEMNALNMRRIRASKPGGTWLDWPDELLADCHRRLIAGWIRGNFLREYGRLEWDKVGVTLTCKFTGYGNGRFGHPEQDRGLSVREGARLQTFPDDYEFVPSDAPFRIQAVAKMIGNAVPVELARVVARSVKAYLGYEVTHRAVGQLRLF